MNNKFVKIQDLVEILANPYFPALEGKRGVVKQCIGGSLVLVGFIVPVACVDKDGTEKFIAQSYSIPWQYVKVLDSAYDNTLGELEEKIQELEEDLMIARSCLGMSEELRDNQELLINKLIEDIDKLQKQIYDLRGF